MTLDQVRHAEERGKILKILQEDYASRMTTVASLTGALDLLGYPMTSESLQFSLTYLHETGYVVALRVRQMPGWRSDRAHTVHPDSIATVKLSAKGLQLVDGAIAEDPLVRF